MHHDLLSLLLLLFLALSSTTATPNPSIWTISISNGPVPPFSRHAIRDRAALRWQIPTLILSYLTFVLLTLFFILTLGRRLRLSAIDNRDARPMEMVKEAKRTFDPSPISPKSASAASWRRIKGFVSSSPVERERAGLAVPSQSQAVFDEGVVRRDREERGRRLGEMYATVYEAEEETKGGGVLSEEDERGRLQYSENWRQLGHEESKESFAVSLDGRAWNAGIRAPSPPEQTVDDEQLPAELSSTPAQAADTQSSPTHRQPSPTRPRLPSHPSRNLRALRITTSSNPSLAPTPTSAIHHSALSSRALTPLTPLRGHPTTPALVQAQTETFLAPPSTGAGTTTTTTIRLVPPHLHTGTEARTPGMALTYISESAQDDDEGDGGEVGSPWSAHGGGGGGGGSGEGTARQSMEPYLNRPLPPLPLDARAQAKVHDQVHSQTQVQAQSQAQAQVDLNREIPLPPTPPDAGFEKETQSTTPTGTPPHAHPHAYPLPAPPRPITVSVPHFTTSAETATSTAMDTRESYNGLPATPRSPYFVRCSDDTGAHPPHVTSVLAPAPARSQAASTQAQPRPRPLPLRTFQPPAPNLNTHAQRLAPLRSPPPAVPTHLTLLSPLQSRFRNGPPTAGLPTPYSPYMPMTPMTPVTPGLQTREERRRRERESAGGRGWGRGRRALGREDVVRSEEEMWGGGCMMNERL